MKVVIGANSLTGPLTGIGHYTRCLVEGLCGREEIDELRLLSHGWLGEPVKPGSTVEQSLGESQSGSDNSGTSLIGKLRPIASRNRLMVEFYDFVTSLTAGISLRKYGPGDIFHSPDFQFARFPGKTVVTIPDLSTLTFPEFHPASRVAYINRHIKRVVEGADHIVAISNFIKNEIIDKLGVPDEKVTTIYPGIDPDFAPISKAVYDEKKDIENLEYKNYFIFISTIEPRKNIERLLKVYKRYADIEGTSTLPLIIVGFPGWKSEHIHAELTRMAGNGQIIYLGYAEREKLKFLLAGARALLFPSVYEGFGLPVVEAMSSGTAVLTSKNSAMAEACDGSALLVSPFDETEILEGVLQLHSDDNGLLRSLELSGTERARLYSWERCAAETINLYLSIE